MDEEIKESGEMATIEGEEEITIEEDYTALEAETVIIDDDSNIQTDAEYEQAVGQKELADGAREALSAVLLSVLEKGEINDDDIAEIAAQQEIYTENVTALKILGLTTEDEKSTTNVITSNIDYNELMKVLSEKADWLYIDEDGQVMLNGEVVPKLKVVELEAEKIKADVGEFKDLTTENFTATNATIENLKANKADIEYLNANYATIENLNATNANITNLQATKANIIDLNAANANIANLQAIKANITDLDAAKADINVLNSDVANIQTLVNGNLTSDNIQSMVITGDKFTVANGFIKNAMIDSVAANKINTGTINTNNVSIQSEDGSMLINGTTQQFKDENGTVRIQIGKDATGNFTFALFSQDGVGVLIDENGIKSGAVPDGLIVNDMVADGANISGSKLDINSVISSINNGTTVIKGTRIQLDEQGQSLQVAFSRLKNKVETIEQISIEGDLSSVIEQVTSNTTSINTMQGQISSLISNTTITKANGEVVQLKDEYNSTKDTVNSHTTKIGSLETNLSTANNNISSVSSKQTALEQNLNGFKQTVSDTYTTKADFNGLSIGGTNLIANSAPKSTSGWDQYAGSSGAWNLSLVDCSTAPYGKAIRATSDNAAGGGIHKQPVDYTKLIKNEYYTLSAWIRASKNCIASFKQEYMPNENIINITTEWKYYSYTDKLTGSDVHSDVIYIRDGVENGMWLEIHSLKLEKGTKPSSWSPAPEDIDSSINTVDGKFVNYSTTSQMNSAINQKANEITSTVSQTYATKSSLKATDDKFADYSTTSAMNSAINQKSDSILSTVSSTYTTKADFNGLTIGGTNLYPNSNFKTQPQYFEQPGGSIVTWDSSVDVGNVTTKYNGKVVQLFDSQGTSSSPKDVYLTFSQTVTLQPNTTYTLSFDYYSAGAFIGTSSYIYLWKTKGDVSTRQVIGLDVTNNNKNKTRLIKTFTTDSEHLIFQFRIGFHDTGTCWLAVDGVKLEKGNRNTEWSPAPKDIDAAIDTVDGKFTNYSTTSQMNSAINQKANEITSTVSETYATKASLTTVDNKFANYSTTSAMNSAIQQKANEITSSVSETYATKTSVTDLSNNLTNNYSTTSQMNSAIDQKANEITSTVSQTYTTKVDFNNLNVGGRNFIINSGFKGVVPDTATFPHWSYWGDVKVFHEQGNTNYNAINTLYLQNHTDVASGIYQDIPYSKIPKNTEITISYDMSREVNVIGSYTTLEFYDTDFNRIGEIQLSDAVGHIVRTVTTPNSDYSIMRFVIGHRGSNSEVGAYLVTVGNIKIEKGNKATDWSPAPEDTDNEFTNYSTTVQMNSAIEQKANEITSTVSQTYATKSSLKATDDKFANYSTTSQMNSAINQKANEITSTVSETYVKTDSLGSLKEEFREELGDYMIIFSKETIIARCNENGNLIK